LQGRDGELQNLARIIRPQTMVAFAVDCGMLRPVTQGSLTPPDT